MMKIEIENESVEVNLYRYIILKKERHREKYYLFECY